MPDSNPARGGAETAAAGRAAPASAAPPDWPVMAVRSPFDLGQPRAYAAWRRAKLDALAQLPRPPTVSLGADGDADAAGCERVRVAVATHGYCLYRLAGALHAGPADTERRLLALGQALGLHGRERTLFAPADGMTRIEVGAGEARGEYIPYTDRAIGWHTDGYYAGAAVRAFLLHCVRPAADGGESRLLDPELVYMQLRDRAPDALATLMRADMLGIPANERDGRTLRDAARVPVFQVMADGALLMRYTARSRHVDWCRTSAASEALARLRETIDALAGDAVQLRLQAGQGVISNNALHARSAFQDDPSRPRLLLRARYYQPVDRPAAARPSGQPAGPAALATEPAPAC